MNDNMKIVYYEEYCPKCKHKPLSESEEPCRHCLGNPVNEYSHKPVYYEERK